MKHTIQQNTFFYYVRRIIWYLDVIFVSKRLINNWILYLTFNNIKKKNFRYKTTSYLYMLYVVWMERAKIKSVYMFVPVQLLWHIFAAGLQIELSFSIWSTKKLGFGKHKNFLSLFSCWNFVAGVFFFFNIY